MKSLVIGTLSLLLGVVSLSGSVANAQSESLRTVSWDHIGYFGKSDAMVRGSVTESCRGDCAAVYARHQKKMLETFAARCSKRGGTPLPTTVRSSISADNKNVSSSVSGYCDKQYRGSDLAGSERIEDTSLFISREADGTVKMTRFSTERCADSAATCGPLMYSKSAAQLKALINVCTRNSGTVTWSGSSPWVSWLTLSDRSNIFFAKTNVAIKCTGSTL